MEKIKIKFEDLQLLLEDESTYAATIEKYFDINNDDPFHPQFQLKSNVEIIEEDESGEKGAFKNKLRDIANNISRRRRSRKFKKMKRNKPDAPLIISEGDSWFQHPLVPDIIDHLMDSGYLVKSLGAGGAELIGMYLQEEYAEIIQMEEPAFFLLSAGGNDILGSKMVYLFNDEVEIDEPGENPERFLNEKFDVELEVLRLRLTEIMNRVSTLSPSTHIIIHGYDYTIPSDRTDKGWVGRYMIEKGITNQKDKMAVMRLILDRHNKMLQTLADQYNSVTYIDLRNTVHANQWYDEIHPDKHGFLSCAEKFKVQLEALLTTSIVA